MTETYKEALRLAEILEFIVLPKNNIGLTEKGKLGLLQGSSLLRKLAAQTHFQEEQRVALHEEIQRLTNEVAALEANNADLSGENEELREELRKLSVALDTEESKGQLRFDLHHDEGVCRV